MIEIPIVKSCFMHSVRNYPCKGFWVGRGKRNRETCRSKSQTFKAVNDT